MERRGRNKENEEFEGYSSRGDKVGNMVRENYKWKRVYIVPFWLFGTNQLSDDRLLFCNILLFFFYWKIVVVSDVHTFYFKKKEKFLNSLFKIQIFALKEVWILCSKKKGNLNSRIQNLLCPCYLSMPFCDKKWRCNLSKLNCYNMLIFTYLRLKHLHYKIGQKVFILI